MDGFGRKNDSFPWTGMILGRFAPIQPGLAKIPLEKAREDLPKLFLDDHNDERCQAELGWNCSGQRVILSHPQFLTDKNSDIF
jgi:hypothetical protein